MSSITAAQKSEIIKQARKELSNQVREVKKESERNRREIASLKRTVAELRKRLKGGDGNGTRARFSAKGLCSERQRLGLSAEDYGKLVGVSAQSIYNWEREVTRPRNKHIHEIAAVRGIGKKEARARLAKMH